MDELEIRRRIVALAKVYAHQRVPYVEPCADNAWSVRDAEPQSLDCSSLVTRLYLVVVGTYYAQLGDPSAASWAGISPGRHLEPIPRPRPGDLVFYQRLADPDDAVDVAACRPVFYHVAVSVGGDRIVAACDVCDHVAEHPERCHPTRWTLLPHPYRRLPISP